MTLSDHLAYLDAAYAEALAAPLSRRKAMLAAALADAYADRLATASGADDILAFRAGLAAQSRALGLVFELCAMGEGAPELAIDAVEVPIAEYGTLGVEDFMVSLYNGHRVQRVRVASPQGERLLALDVLAEAIGVLRGLTPAP